MMTVRAEWRGVMRRGVASELLELLVHSCDAGVASATFAKPNARPARVLQFRIVDGRQVLAGGECGGWRICESDLVRLQRRYDN